LWKLKQDCQKLQFRVTEAELNNLIHYQEHGGTKKMSDSKAAFDRELEERFLRYRMLDRARQSTLVEDNTDRDKPQLKMKWIIVTENGTRQLRMQWSVQAKSGAGRHAA